MSNLHAITGAPVEVVEERPGATPEEVEPRRFGEYVEQVFRYAEDTFAAHESERRYVFLKRAFRDWEIGRQFVIDGKWTELRKRLTELA
jgi:hypothetical protein